MAKEINKKTVLTWRKANKLHEITEKRLKVLLDKVAPGSYTLKEGWGTTSGRTDTTTFLGNGRVIHIEIIASKKMVLPDLNNLSQSSADLKVSVLIDEQYDPRVIETYYRANAKNLYPVILLSDILSSKREEHALGRIEGLIQDLERQIEDTTSKAKLKLKNFLNRLSYPKGSPLLIHLGVISRRSLDFRGGVTDERELFGKLEPLGVHRAASPLGGAGLDWEFSHGGSFFIVKTVGGGGLFFTQAAIGSEGEIFFNFVNGSKIDTLTASGFLKFFNPTLDFAQKLFEEYNYNGVVDILVSFKGLKGIKWIQKGHENNPVAQMLYKRKFYEDNISIPAMSKTVAELGEDKTRQEFYDKIWKNLKWNTKRFR